MLTAYRERLSDFHTETQRARYLFAAGFRERPETAGIIREYSDLFTRERVAELRAALADTPAWRETECAAIRRLIGAALAGYLAERVRELTTEIERSEAEARVTWDGAALDLSAASLALAREPDPARRHDLYRRRAEALRGADDLRAERLEKRGEAARELGYTSLLACYREQREADDEGVAARLGDFLSRTEAHFATALAPLVARSAGRRLDEATAADLGLTAGLGRFDPFFAREWLLAVYRATAAGLGIDIERQSNIEVDAEPRAGKRARALCVPVRIPGEVRLLANPAGGWGDYAAFLDASGQAQRCAWTSANLAPELRRDGDAAVARAYGFLFGGLLLDARWLAEIVGFSESAEFRQTLAVARFWRARRAAAGHRYAVEFCAGLPAAAAGPRYAELLSDAARVRVEATGHLRALDEPFAAGDELRGGALEAQLREHLRSRYGWRWWASPKAGEMLIDLWNTGLRHSAEGLASLVGLGELSFDWLAEELIAQVKM